MFCSNCGIEVNPESKFCHSCGNRLAYIPKDIVAEKDSIENKTCTICNQPKNRIYIGINETDKFVCPQHDITKGICPNCNLNLRTEKSEQCHHCKASWRKKAPTEIKNIPVGEKAISCPKCRSTHYSANRKGVGVKRAIVGGLIAGPVGLLAGATGRKSMELSCLKCGHRWSV